MSKSLQCSMSFVLFGKVSKCCDAASILDGFISWGGKLFTEIESNGLVVNEKKKQD